MLREKYPPFLEAKDIERNCRYMTSLDSMDNEIPMFLLNLEDGINMIERQLFQMKNVSWVIYWSHPHIPTIFAPKARKF